MFLFLFPFLVLGLSLGGPPTATLSYATLRAHISFHSLALQHFFPITLNRAHFFLVFVSPFVVLTSPLYHRSDSNCLSASVCVHEAFVFGFLLSFGAAAAATQKWIQMGKNDIEMFVSVCVEWHT